MSPDPYCVLSPSYVSIHPVAFAYTQTNKQTNKEMDRGGNITSLVEADKK